jgi:hypothetical protein
MEEQNMSNKSLSLQINVFRVQALEQFLKPIISRIGPNVIEKRRERYIFFSVNSFFSRAIFHQLMSQHFKI